MKIITKNTVFTVLKIGIITSLLGAFMLVGVDLFRNLDTYTSYRFPIKTVLLLCVMNFPDCFLISLGPAFLFSVTYFLSAMYASNEMICILNSGVSMRKILQPIIVLSFVIGLLFFIFNETVAIPVSNKRTLLKQTYSHTSDNKDNSLVALSDPYEGYTVFANKYSNSKKTLTGVTIVENDSNGKVIRRTNAEKAVWDETEQKWTLHNCSIYSPDNDEVKISKEKSLVSEVLKLEPELFRNLSSDISKMSLPLAFSYMKRLKTLNPTQYSSLGTEFYKRALSCLTPVIMIIIACCMNFRFKKNVLFFSIICSLCTAVVYYVVQMVTQMLATQGVIHPALGMIIPFVVISTLAFGFILIKKD